MKVAHVRCNVPPWEHPTLERLDEALATAGSHPLHLEWHDLPLQADGEHLTRDGVTRFAHRLGAAIEGAALGPLAHVHVVTDSTVGDLAPWAHERVRRRLRRLARRVTIDAVNGSGFVARAAWGEHFAARRRAASLLLFVGGWNDAGCADPEVVARAARGCLRPPPRHGRKKN